MLDRESLEARSRRTIIYHTCVVSLNYIDVGDHKRHSRMHRLTCVTNMELSGAEFELLITPLLHTTASEPVLASLKVGGVGLGAFSSLVTV